MPVRVNPKKRTRAQLAVLATDKKEKEEQVISGFCCKCEMERTINCGRCDKCECVIDVKVAKYWDNYESDDSTLSEDDATSLCLPTDEKEHALEISHSPKFWNKFFLISQTVHQHAAKFTSATEFMDSFFPPVNPKWKDRVMYAFVYHGEYTKTWKYYQSVTRAQDLAIKAYVKKHPRFEIAFGNLEGKHSNVTVRFVKLVEWETSNPRLMEYYDPSTDEDGYMCDILEKIEEEKLSE